MSSYKAQHLIEAFDAVTPAVMSDVDAERHRCSLNLVRLHATRTILTVESSDGERSHVARLRATANSGGEPRRDGAMLVAPGELHNIAQWLKRTGAETVELTSSNGRDIELYAPMHGQWDVGGVASHGASISWRRAADTIRTSL